MRGLLIALFVASPFAAVTAQEPSSGGSLATTPSVVEQLSSTSDELCIAVCKKSFSTLIREDKEKALLRSCEFTATCSTRLLLGPSHYTAGTHQEQWNSLDMIERLLRGDGEIKG